MPDEDRVFDVTRPSRVSPHPAGKPVIVGHHPANDPMVNQPEEHSVEANPPMKIQISDADVPIDTSASLAATEPPEPAPELKAEEPIIIPDSAEPAVQEAVVDSHPLGFGENSAEPATTNPPLDPPAEPAPEPETKSETGLVSPVPTTESAADSQPQVEIPSHVKGLEIMEPEPHRKWLRWTIALVLVLLIGLYLALDSGLIKSSINLPFHIFKQKTPVATTNAPATTKQTTTTPALPAGFKSYDLTGTDISFAAPVAWGDPSSTTEPGFSKRGADSQPDGIYAYLVSFATNKDIEIVVTSAKYLPPARATLYYDYLQWCTGTSDDKIYQTLLHFSTTNKVDTPTTSTCDQGPLDGALKLDSTTILQAKATDSTSKVIGDVYTKNLTDPALVVLRVKDASMTKGVSIKQLLGTVKVAPAQSP